MQTRQYSVKVCELTLTNNDDFKSFFDVNYILFQDHLIIINGEVDDDIKSYLDDKNLKFLVNQKLPLGKTRQAVEEEVQKLKDKYIQSQEELEYERMILESKSDNNLKVLDTIIRSGQELNIKTDLLLLNRINSGSRININGNLIATHTIDGAIRSTGDFMVIKASSKANIVFHNIEVDNKDLEVLSRVEILDYEVAIKPILKKEENWEQ